MVATKLYLTSFRVLVAVCLAMLVWVSFVRVWGSTLQELAVRFNTPSDVGMEVYFVDHEDLPSSLVQDVAAIDVALVNSEPVHTNHVVTLRADTGRGIEILATRLIELEPSAEGIVEIPYMLPEWLVRQNFRTRLLVYVDNAPQLHFWLEPVESTVLPIWEVE